MEHPTGAFETAIHAMDDAVSRLRELPEWNRWITFCAQGEGLVRGRTAFAEVRMLGGEIDLGHEKLKLAKLLPMVGLSPSAVVLNGSILSVGAISSREVAELMDAIFRHHFGIRPFPDEDNDYAVGAEW